MSTKALSLDELRALVGVSAPREALDFSLVHEGLPKGAITQVVGSGKTEFVLTLLAEHAETKVAWVEENFSVYPFGFLQRNVQLGRVLFVESGEHTCWSILQILKAQVFSIVVIYSENLGLNELRKIQLAAEKAQAVVLWLTPELKSLWPVSLQIKVGRDLAELTSQVLRRRF
jgi:hypothetical protein